MNLRGIKRRTAAMIGSTEVVTVKTDDTYVSLVASILGRDHDKVQRAIRQYVKQGKVKP